MPHHESQPMPALSRRGLLKMAGSAAIGAALAARSTHAAEASAPQAFRFVQMTDIHVQPQRKAAEGLRAAIEAAHKLTPRPDFILTTGDLVFDALNTPEPRVRTLFDLYTSICRDSDLPIRQCIGNHECFGWSNSKVSKDHPEYGKKMAADRLGLDKLTYSFDHKGWHFCVVDDILPNDSREGYHGGISDENMDWLDKDLTAAGGRPKIICAHIPLLSAVIYRNMEARDKEFLEVSRRRVCRNPGPIMDLLRKHKVGLSLAGHLHQNERIELDGTTYITSGAVSGAWWKGAHFGNAEGFGIIDVKADGTFEHRYHEYGWKAVGEADA